MPPWEKYGTAHTPPDTSGPWAKYNAPSAPSEAKPVQAEAPEAKFPYDDPKHWYGNILPIRTEVDPKTGQSIPGTREFAAPEIVRSLARGVLGLNARMHSPVGYQEPMTQDELGALMMTGGVRASPGSITEAAGARAAAKAAHEAGYVIPPAEATDQPSILSRILSAPSGKVKTQQAASETNQEITNTLARKALGLKEGTQLTDKVFEDVIGQAGQAYQKVKDSIPTVYVDLKPEIGQWYDHAVEQLGGSNSHAAQYFPDITKNPGIKQLVGELSRVREFPTDAGVEVVKELRFNANANLKAIGDPSKHALGLAQRQAAEIIDELMDQNIEAAGKPGLVDDYRKARQLIAKAYDVQGATNLATGDVNARGLAKLAAKGRPLSGELKTIADVAAAFPKDVQPVEGFGGYSPWSALDFFGAVASGAAGHPGAAAGIIARPLARATVLSGPYQRAIMGAPTFGQGPLVSGASTLAPSTMPLLNTGISPEMPQIP